jgi:hypothetical protein
MSGCTPLLKDPKGHYWALGVGDQGNPTTVAFNEPIQFQSNPILTDTNGQSTNWQFSATTTGAIVATQIFSLPTIRKDNLPYIPLISPSGFAYIFTVTSQGNIQTTFLPLGLIRYFPDVIPYIPNVTMSQYGNYNPSVTCPVCANAVIQVSADLSCWCCTCSCFVPPEDTTMLVVLDE